MIKFQSKNHLRRFKSMKFKVLFAGLFLLGAGEAWSYPQFQDRGAVSTGTVYAVTVTTTVELLLSTGANVMSENETPSFFVQQGTSSLPVKGNYMEGRVFLEIYNDSTKDIWFGYTRAVSTQTGADYGRRIPSGASWSSNSSIRDYWVVSDTTTERRIVVIQEK